MLARALRISFLPIAAILSLTLTGCQFIPPSVFDQLHDAGATRDPQGGPTFPLIGTSGQTLGTVRMWESPGAVTFRIEARGLPHGVHGLHVHATGRCDRPDFVSAGAHWNPSGRQHGIENPAGPHLGDMVNITVAANGAVQQTVPLLGASFAALYDASGDGSAVVIHADPDDYRTDPSGNSGARIACAVLGTAR